MGTPNETTSEQTTRRIDRIDEILEWINGNGKPGAKTKLALIDERFTTLEQRFDRLEKRMDAMTGAIRTFAFTILTGVALYVLTDLLPRLIQMSK